jgi:hypothetical protein
MLCKFMRSTHQEAAQEVEDEDYDRERQAQYEEVSSRETYTLHISTDEQCQVLSFCSFSRRWAPLLWTPWPPAHSLAHLSKSSAA